MPQEKKGASLDAATRAQIAESLLPAIGYAIQCYRNFATQQCIVDSKSFGAYHTACKAGVAHIHLLLKLAAWADLPAADDDSGLALLVADAEGELERYHAGEDGDGDGDV